MARPRKPEPPLIDDQPGRLVESPEPGETPADRDVEKANAALQSDDVSDDHEPDDGSAGSKTSKGDD